MAIDKFKGGGTVAGAITGFFLAGPVGALVGAGAGYAGGSAWSKKMVPLKTSSTITVAPGKQSATVLKGGTLGIMPPEGGEVVSVAPAQGSNATHVSVVSGHGVVSGEVSGDVNVMWRAKDGSAQASIVTVNVT